MSDISTQLDQASSIKVVVATTPTPGPERVIAGERHVSDLMILGQKLRVLFMNKKMFTFSSCTLDRESSSNSTPSVVRSVHWP